MYDLLIRKAADLWAGSDPSEVTLDRSEYLRGQVELIVELGVLTPYTHHLLDQDQSKVLVARDIRDRVSANDLLSGMIG